MIYLDANVIIRFIEADAASRAPIQARLQAAPGLVTSQLSRLECRSFPIRRNDAALLKLYDDFFAGHELLVLDVSSAVIDRATELRARFNLRAPDAIHVATALLSGASALVTGDKALTRCPDIPVELL